MLFRSLGFTLRNHFETQEKQCQDHILQIEEKLLQNNKDKAILIGSEEELGEKERQLERNKGQYEGEIKRYTQWELKYNKLYEEQWHR